MLAISTAIKTSAQECSGIPGLVVNGGFESPDLDLSTPFAPQVFGSPPTAVKIYNEADVLGWETTASDNRIELWQSGFNGVVSYEGVQHAELNANSFGAFFQDLISTENTEVLWSFAHRGRSGVDTVEVLIGPPGGPLQSQGTFSTGTSSWDVKSGVYTVPPGQTVTRFQFFAISTGSGSSTVGNFIDDVRVVPRCDYGDAPASYPVIRANNGAAHRLDIGSFLGSGIDTEFDGDSAGNNAQADDLADTDDEDGVVYGDVAPSQLVRGRFNPIEVEASNAGFVNLWVDLDGDGDWQVDEQLLADEAVSAGTQVFFTFIPSNVPLGPTFARTRYTTDDPGGALGPGGDWANGEVEDDAIAIAESSVTHYALSHSGAGITCEAEAVTITAHNDAHVAINNGGNTIRVSATSNTPGWSSSDATWAVETGAGNLSFVSAGVVDYRFASGESEVVLGLGNVSVADIDIDVMDLVTTAVTDNDGGSEDPVLTFVDSAFRFYDDANGDGDADGTNPIVSTLVSGQSSAQLILRAVETDAETGACQARLLGMQTIDMAYECVDPTTCVRNQDMEINNSAIEENDLGVVSDYLGVDLSFDAEGEATFALEYFDVGEVRLHARLDLAAGGGEPAFTLSGTSASTTVMPADLRISLVETSSSAANPETTASGAGFIAAGEPFTVQVQARNAAGGIAPNYGREVAAEGVQINALSLVMPVGGNLAPLNSAAGFSPTSTLGEFENTAVSWPEVGTLTINASVADGDYLGAGDVVGSSSVTIGRFYPDRFALVSASSGEECSMYSYMSDQLFEHRPIDFSVDITAQNAAGDITTNYDDALGYPVGGFNAVAENANDGEDLSDRAFIADGVWSLGQYQLTGGDNGGFSRELVGADEIPDGPFLDLQMGLQTDGTDLDAVNFLTSSLDMHPAQDNDCVSDTDCNSVALGGLLELRFARLYGKSVHGPESAPLNVPLQMQYWTGSGFVVNEADSCTELAMSDVSFDSNSLSDDNNRNVDVGGVAGATTGTFGIFVPGTRLTFLLGDADLNFSAPGSGVTGNFNVSIDLANYAWLRSDWNSDGDYSDDPSLPDINVTFGSYRGHDRIIYWREVLNN